MRIFKIIATLVCFNVLVSGQTHPSDEPDFTMSLKDGVISGSVDTKENHLEFLVDYSDEYVEVTYVFNEMEITLSLDLIQERVVYLSGASFNNDVVTMRKNDRQVLQQLLHAFQLNVDALKGAAINERAEPMKFLVKSTELLVTFGVGRSINVDFDSDKSITRSWVSLCNAIGQTRTAYWTNYNSTRFKNFVVGGHGVCKGRCGAGCPWFADPAYTQDCLNHDACAGEEGAQFGPCADEWNAAADDFLFAPDCT